MVISAAAVYAGSVIAAGTILKLEEENALLNGGSYVRDGVPEDLTGKIGQQLARRACLAYGANPDSVDEVAALKYERACRPYLDDVGGGAGPQIKPPFTGGQCAGVDYTAFLATNDDPTGPIGGSVAVRGPVTALSKRVVPSGNPSFPIRLFVSATGANGTEESSGVVTLASTANLVSPRLLRVDGGADTCGNPPPDVVQPTPDPTPQPEPGPITISPDVDINVAVVLVAPGAIVFNFGTGPITVDPFADEPVGGGGGGELPPGDIGLPGLPEGTGFGGEVEGEAAEGEVLTGLRIDFAAPPRAPNEYKPGIYRGVCYIYMGTSSGLDHDPAGSMLTPGQFVFAEKDNLTHWRVSANLGYSLSVTPYYRTVET